MVKPVVACGLNKKSKPISEDKFPPIVQVKLKGGDGAGPGGCTPKMANVILPWTSERNQRGGDRTGNIEGERRIRR